MIAAAYVRVSTEEQAREGLSLRVQEQRCREVAEADGATDVRVFRDEGYSGTSTDRPGLQELLDDLAELDVVYVWKLDRLSRSLRDTLELFATLGRADVGLKSASEKHDYTSPTGKLFLAMHGAIAEFFIDQLKENTRAALRARTEQGRYHGPPPLGYRTARDAEGSTIEVMPGEAELVQRIFDSYARGKSLAALARDLQSEGVPQKRTGTRWMPATVRSILTNPVYIGRFRMGGETFDGIHESIISERMWASVQARRRRRVRLPARARDGTLCPLLRCGACPDGDGPVGRTLGRGKQEGYHWYFCRLRRELLEPERHDPIAISGPAVDAVIWAYARELVGSGDLAAAQDRKEVRERDVPARTGAAALAGLDEEIERNLDAYQAEAIPLELLTSRNQPLMKERDRLREKLDQEEAARLDAAPSRSARELTVEGLERIRKRAAPGRQRDFLEGLFERVVITRACGGDGKGRGGRGRLTFHHRWGADPVTLAVPGYYRADGSTVIDLTPLPPDAGES